MMKTSKFRFLISVSVMPGLIGVLVGAGLVATGCAHDPSTTVRSNAEQCSDFSSGKREQTFGQDVVAVRPIRRRVGKQMVFRTLGADVVIQSRRGDSAPWLQRLVSCRLADGWFADKAQADVVVFASGSEFVVRVTSSEPGVGKTLADQTVRRWGPRQARR